MPPASRLLTFGPRALANERSILIDGNSVAFIRAGGQGAAVLLIHGKSASKEVLEHKISFLAECGLDVIAADLPGHGASDNASEPRETYSFPGYGRVLRRLMSGLGIDQYHVVGWSLGGHIGLEMWFEDEAVRSLTITGTPPVRLSPIGASEGFLPSTVMDLAGKENFSRADVSAYGSAMLGESIDPDSWFGRRVARTDGTARSLMLQNGLAGLGHDEESAVALCPKPLAILQGRNDPFVNLSHLERLAYGNLWLNSPVMIDGGHAPHWTHPSEFNRCLVNFIAESDGP